MAVRDLNIEVLRSGGEAIPSCRKLELLIRCPSVPATRAWAKGVGREKGCALGRWPSSVSRFSGGYVGCLHGLAPGSDWGDMYNILLMRASVAAVFSGKGRSASAWDAGERAGQPLTYRSAVCQLAL